jgi:hypothetical protein
MVKLIAELRQVSNVDFTLIVPMKSAPLTFTGARYEGMTPVPLAAKPMAIFVFVQLNVSFGLTLLVKAAGEIEAPGQTVILDSATRTGVGLTWMRKVIGSLTQLALVPVTVIVPD